MDVESAGPAPTQSYTSHRNNCNQKRQSRLSFPAPGREAHSRLLVSGWAPVPCRFLHPHARRHLTTVFALAEMMTTFTRSSGPRQRNSVHSRLSGAQVQGYALAPKRPA